MCTTCSENVGSFRVMSLTARIWFFPNGELSGEEEKTLVSRASEYRRVGVGEEFGWDGGLLAVTEMSRMPHHNRWRALQN